MRYFLFILFLFLTSCGTERLLVQSEYLLPDRYASVWVGTPDPHKYYPNIGQRLIIQWKLKTEFQTYEKIVLRMRIRFRNYEVLDKVYHIKCPVGRMIYTILDDDYKCTDGIAAYDIQVYGDSELIAEIRHHLWKEIIVIEDEDEDYDDLDLTPQGEIPNEFQYEPQFEEGTQFYKV